MKPNPKNFCGGNYNDWVEVMLTPKCNGKCAWCVDKNGFHPKEEVDWKTLADTIIALNKRNIILLGGEPTLYRKLPELVSYLSSHNRDVYITTNGSHMTFIGNNISKLAGLNVSIHHYDLYRNKDITGILVNFNLLERVIKYFKEDKNIHTRLNCTLINGEIDSVHEINEYIEFAKSVRATSVRFAELKHDSKFVNLYELFGNAYGFSNNPFVNGCSTDAVLNGMPVSFRQMCGLQTSFRPLPTDLEAFGNKKSVVYYNGVVYDGWQTKDKEIEEMKLKDKNLSVKQILEKVKSGQMTIETANKLLEKKAQTNASDETDRYDGSCRY